jgi:hypothetical protein
LLHEQAQLPQEIVSNHASLGVARSAVLPVLGVVFTIFFFERKGLIQKPLLYGRGTGLFAHFRELRKESKGYCLVLLLPDQLSTRFAALASASKCAMTCIFPLPLGKAHCTVDAGGAELGGAELGRLAAPAREPREQHGRQNSNLKLNLN